MPIVLVISYAGTFDTGPSILYYINVDACVHYQKVLYSNVHMLLGII